MFTSWFKPKNKKNIVVPSAALGLMQGVELIQAFSTDDEPKLNDFKKEQYKVYWETFVNPVVGGYAALVRFYSYEAGLLSEHTIAKQNVQELRKEVTALILEIMSRNKRA